MIGSAIDSHDAGWSPVHEQQLTSNIELIPAIIGNLRLEIILNPIGRSAVQRKLDELTIRLFDLKFKEYFKVGQDMMAFARASTDIVTLL